MHKKIAIALPILAVLGLGGALAWYIHNHTIAVLQPAGEIAQKERALIYFAVLLSVLVVVPVYILTIVIVLRYRETNTRTKLSSYRPDWNGSWRLETLWWGIPLLIIGILSVVTWVSAHQLDPYKPIDSTVKPINIQVVALNWKWLFIYPDQNIASVNLAEVPVGTPISLSITSDTVMNSFWVPQLGGQIYAMPGMSTQLHLIADKTGSYFGSPANIAGSGFAHMDFTVRAVSARDFSSWTKTAMASGKSLDIMAYQQLAQPSQDNPVRYYAPVAPNLYNSIVMHYMAPSDMTMGGM